MKIISKINVAKLLLFSLKIRKCIEKQKSIRESILPGSLCRDDMVYRDRAILHRTRYLPGVVFRYRGAK